MAREEGSRKTSDRLRGGVGVGKGGALWIGLGICEVLGYKAGNHFAGLSSVGLVGEEAAGTV